MYIFQRFHDVTLFLDIFWIFAKIYIIIYDLTYSFKINRDECFAGSKMILESGEYAASCLDNESSHQTVLSVQFNPVAQSCPSLCNPMNCSMPGLPVHHQLLELAQSHVYWVSDSIQPSHPLLSPSPPTFNLSQHQGIFQWVTSLHQVAKVL